jgi:VanZ family protein
MTSGGLQPSQEQRAGSGREIWNAWLWTAVWVAAIYLLASDHFSAEGTSRFLGPLLRWLFQSADAEWIPTAHFAIRRAAHVTEYAILAVLGLRALRLSFARSTAWLAPLTLALVLLVAAVDESRQANSEERTGAIGDVALDFAGGIGGLVLALAAQRYRSLPA